MSGRARREPASGAAAKAALLCTGRPRLPSLQPARRACACTASCFESPGWPTVCLCGPVSHLASARTAPVTAAGCRPARRLRCPSRSPCPSPSLACNRPVCAGARGAWAPPRQQGGVPRRGGQRLARRAARRPHLHPGAGAAPHRPACIKIGWVPGSRGSPSALLCAQLACAAARRGCLEPRCLGATGTPACRPGSSHAPRWPSPPTRQKDHSTFKRIGTDLFFEKSVSLVEALCGEQSACTHASV